MSESMDSPGGITAAATMASAKAEILIESLPWLKKFRGRTIVVKFGGNAMVDIELQRAFAEDMVYLHHVGVHPVVVHGGGPQISARLAERDIQSEFRGGLRVTTPEVLEVVREVLAGEVNAHIVDLINEHSIINEHSLAVGLSGESDALLQARQRTATVDGVAVDIGLVGDVATVDPAPLLAHIAAGHIPVISSFAPDVDVPGRSLNVNADSAAAAIAGAVGAAKLVILTDVAGLYSDWPDRESLVSSIGADELHSLLPTLESGMIPKMTACLDAVRGGVAKAAIIDGRQQHSILLELFTHSGIGTEVVV